MTKVKLTGSRSIASKLHRLAYELADDSARVRADYPAHDSIASGIREISSQLGKLARRLENENG